MARIAPHAIQQAILYLLTAMAIGFSVYSKRFPSNDNSASPTEILLSVHGVELIGAGILVIAGAASIWRARHGALLALFGTGLIGLMYIVAGCPWLLLFIPFMLMPYVFWGFVFPALLLSLSFAYSRRVRSSTDELPTVLAWLSVPQSSPRGWAILIVFVTVVGTLGTVFSETEIGVVTETYRVELRDISSPPERPHGIDLVFLDHPCWQLYTLSPSLHAYALSLENPVVDMVIERRYQLQGIWLYKVLRVGEWTGSAEYHLQLSYSSNDPNCTDSPCDRPTTSSRMMGTKLKFDRDSEFDEKRVGSRRQADRRCQAQGGAAGDGTTRYSEMGPRVGGLAAVVAGSGASAHARALSGAVHDRE